MQVEKRNLVLSNITERLQYKSRPTRGKTNYPKRPDIKAHSDNVRNSYDRVYTQKEIAAIKTKGTYAEFSGANGYELAIKSLESRREGVKLLNVRTVDDTVKATVYIPAGKEGYFRDKIKAYASEKTKNDKPKNQNLIGSIEDIRLALLDSFWTDKPEKKPTSSKKKCEIWLRFDFKKDVGETWHQVEESFHSICDELNIIVDKDKRIVFPERLVKIVTANQSDLKRIVEVCEDITEIKGAEEPASFFTELDPWEQDEWIHDLLNRCSFTRGNTSICLLDAGICENHKLLAPAIAERGIQTIDSSWGTGDSPMWRGHGTRMAGVAIYNDLQALLESTETIEIAPQLESVKILPNSGENQENLYGYITQQAVYSAEIENPDLNRVICMAVTSKGGSYEDGRPSSWSAAIDELISGAADAGSERRVFVISAGNIREEYYKEHTFPDILESVEDPGQSWNAITVGGYADKIDISHDSFKGFSALAPRDGISPYSKTSVIWDRKWPVKPEVLFKGGNIATNNSDYSECEDLALLTTGNKRFNRFSTIRATSAAAAQAAHFVATLKDEYPDYWPETIRGLMIHSARWTDEMFSQFCPSKGRGTKSSLRLLLRSCGYGIPDINRAIQCLNNSVNMIVQAELQPFKKISSSDIRMNEMHFHSFPWPNDLLRDLGDTEVQLRITLSYFIEPSPCENGWKDKYKYASCGLKFDLIRTNESIEEFKYRVNLKTREEGKELDSSASSYNWFLGPNNRDGGSIHSDYITTTAAELCDSKYVAVYPVGGWWKERPYLGKSENHVKYSLIVSLSTPEETIDLYTPIVTQITSTINTLAQV